MRKLLRHQALNVLGQFSHIDKGVHFLAGHYVSAEEKPEKVFQKLVKNLSNEADLVNIEVAIEAARSGIEIKDKMLAFTFDDGFEECYTKLAPVLANHNVNAAFFIIPDYINGSEEKKENIRLNRLSGARKIPMSKKQIRELAAQNFMIGAHTMGHIRLDINDPIILKEQIIDCKKEVSKISGKECHSFAWPYGLYKDVSEAAMKMILENYTDVFSSQNMKQSSLVGNQILNRRHFEGDFPLSHIRYFLRKKYN